MFKARFQTDTDGEEYFLFWCVGCLHLHSFRIKAGAQNAPGAPVWQFDGNRQKPTFSPSLLNREPLLLMSPDRICHLFLRNGTIEYLSDCTHSFAGKNVEVEMKEDDES